MEDSHRISYALSQISIDKEAPEDQDKTDGNGKIVIGFDALILLEELLVTCESWLTNIHSIIDR